MAAEISHDAFTRESLYRETVRTWQPCDHCDNNKHKRLFVYSVKPDDDLSGTRERAIKGRFCSIECMRQYHGTD